MHFKVDVNWTVISVSYNYIFLITISTLYSVSDLYLPLILIFGKFTNANSYILFQALHAKHKYRVYMFCFFTGKLFVII